MKQKMKYNKNGNDIKTKIHKPENTLDERWTQNRKRNTSTGTKLKPKTEKKRKKQQEQQTSSINEQPIRGQWTMFQNCTSSSTS